MRAIKVTFEDGNSLQTDVNGTDEQIRRYYIGTYFQFGDTEECPRDKLVKAVAVEFLGESGPIMKADDLTRVHYLFPPKPANL